MARERELRTGKRNFQQRTAREGDQLAEVSDVMQRMPSSEPLSLSRIKGELAALAAQFSALKERIEAQTSAESQVSILALTARVVMLEETMTLPKPAAPQPRKSDLTARLLGVVALILSAACLALIVAAKVGVLPR